MHNNGTVTFFYPYDEAYLQYVANNGVCEDTRTHLNGMDPHGGSYWYDDFLEQWYGYQHAPFMYENLTSSLNITYPWTLNDLFNVDVNGDCDPGTDCSDCSVAPPPSAPPPTLSPLHPAPSATHTPSALSSGLGLLEA